jgi:hypothetical protein
MCKLAFTQDRAQLQFVLLRRSDRPGGWLSVVRHWAPRPVCGTDVDPQDGGRAFPGRVAGRCAAAPNEQVSSFDPVLLQGSRLLRHVRQC